ncbi:exonuclease A [Synechococcus phage S-B68]|nr:exonuclease A [Synechococcus phage S-B68]
MSFIQRDDFHSKFVDNLHRKQIDGIRHYLKEGSTIAYPSVTSVLSFINGPKFAEWRKRVGEEAANKKTKHATTRGTRLHTLFEHYLNNEDVTGLDEYQVPLVNLMFKSAKGELAKRITNIYQQETQMSSDRLCLAGTVDLICDWDGELAVVDFKTSERTKPEAWLENYFVQLSAYWAMFSEATGVVPKKLVVFLVAENGDIQIVERRNIMDYLKTLRDYVCQFIESRDV